MPRRYIDSSLGGDPPRKRSYLVPETLPFNLKHNEFLQDVTGKQWKLGKAVGVGGFGQIYLASDNLVEEVKTDSLYVAKVESHKNGPLFVEMNCYLRIAKPFMIEEWKKLKKLSSLGMPHYIASGSHIHKGERYRFLILPRYDEDLEKILQKKEVLNVKTVLTISSQIIDVLEYIHNKGYIHSDIKGSNILLSNKKVMKTYESQKLQKRYPVSNPIRTCRIQKSIRFIRNLRPYYTVNYVDDIPNFEEIISTEFTGDNEVDEKGKNRDQVYLVDYGLASKFLMSTGEHKPFCIDERKAHAGTILFCSRDAHKGVPSRRSDLESLGYNIIYWLTGNLPWSNDVENPEIVHKKKQKAMINIENFLNTCFIEYPKFLLDYFMYLQHLQFQEQPDYSYCKNLFKESITDNGYKDDSAFDFGNSQSSNLKMNNLKKLRRVSENVGEQKLVHKILRPPLQSNVPVKPLLRKEAKNKQNKKSTWFAFEDPEIILKQAREKRNMENDSNLVANIADMDIDRLNPTYAMLEIYNKCRERIDASPTYKGDNCFDNVNGYTQAMMSVYNKMKKRKEYRCEQLAVDLTDIRNSTTLKKYSIKRKKKSESSNKSLIETGTTKSAGVMKKEYCQTRKTKNSSLRRTYSLKG